MIVLNSNYNIEEDWNHELYYAIKLQWNYKEENVDISMPNYVHIKLIEYNHKSLKHTQNYLFEPEPMIYDKNRHHTIHRRITTTR